METKDWILMVVPIISNGILVFLIQSIFQSRLKHNEHKDEVKRKINSELFSLLLESKNNFRALGHCLTDHPESTELFNQNLGKFNFGIRKLLDYYNDYSFYLSNYFSIIQRLESTYNEYIAFGRSHLTLNNESRQQLQDYINTLFKLICNASERYIKEI